MKNEPVPTVLWGQAHFLLFFFLAAGKQPTCFSPLLRYTGKVIKGEGNGMTGLAWGVRTILLLFCALRLGRLELPLWRLLATGALAGLWQQAACSVPVLRTAAMQGVLLAFELLLAFSCTTKAVRGGILLMLLSFVLEGLVLALEPVLPGAWVPAGALVLCCTLVARPPQRLVEPVTVTVEGRSVQLLALHDTGNSLRDPISGSPVLVAEWTKARCLFPADCAALLTQETFEAPVTRMTDLAARWPGAPLRLVPYHAVGTKSGMLLAVGGTLTWSDGRTEKGVVAFSAAHVSDGRRFEALAGGLE